MASLLLRLVATVAVFVAIFAAASSVAPAQYPLMFDNLSTALPQILDDHLRALAIARQTR